MKKILIGLFFLTFVFLGGIEFSQATVPAGTPTNDTTPRIMYWYGKVNQHIDEKGVWQTDPDGTSGANIDKLTYCKKWFPETVRVEPYKSETIITWRAAGNTGAYTSTKISDKCIQGVITTTTDTMTTEFTVPTVNLDTPSITITSPNGGQVYKEGHEITVEWESNFISENESISIIIVNINDPSDFVYIIDEDDYFNDATSLNDGTETFIIPSENASGEPFPKDSGENVYVIKVESKYLDVSDTSDNPIVINSIDSLEPIITEPTVVPDTTTGENNEEGETEINQEELGGSDDTTTQEGLLPGDDSLISSNDTTPRIMYWYGKVNQHIDEKGFWQTDPDGTSGANIDKLTYCKKWFPNTVSIKDYKLETITTWRERGNVNAWTSTKMSTECVQSAVEVDLTTRIMYWYGKVNQHVDEKGVWQTDPDGTSGANIDKLTYCKKWFPNTTATEDYKLETITTWREKGNVNAWISTKMSTKCVTEDITSGENNSNKNKDNKNKDCLASVFNKTLKLYSKGEEVKSLQSVLSDHGYLSLSEIDGSFGPKTKDALIAFQIDNGLLGDGIAGPITRSILKIKWQAQCLLDLQ